MKKIIELSVEELKERKSKEEEELSVEELKERKSKEEEKLSKLRKDYDHLSRSIMRIVNKLKTIDNELDSRTLDKNDISSLLEVFPETKIKRDLLRNFLKKWEWGIRSNGYYPDTGQSALQISLYRDDDEHTQMVHDGILELLPYVKPLKDGNRRFDIFEHTLSYYCSYDLVVTEGNIFKVTTGRSYRDPIYESKNLIDVLKYIQKNLYYEKKKATDE